MQRSSILAEFMLGFVQEYKTLKMFDGVEGVVQVIEFDDGVRSSGQNVHQHLYLEFVDGRDLGKVIARWKNVCKCGRSVDNLYHDAPLKSWCSIAASLSFTFSQYIVS